MTDPSPLIMETLVRAHGCLARTAGRCGLCGRQAQALADAGVLGPEQATHPTGGHMTAELLREAAALMRRRAEAATPGPWESSVWDSGLSYRALNASVITSLMGDSVAHADYDGYAEGPHGAEGADAAHIASWHPLVALAVADWLDAEGERSELMSTNVYSSAVKVARAYLGRDA